MNHHFTSCYTLPASPQTVKKSTVGKVGQHEARGRKRSRGFWCEAFHCSCLLKLQQPAFKTHSGSATSKRFCFFSLFGRQQSDARRFDLSVDLFPTAGRTDWCLNIAQAGLTALERKKSWKNCQKWDKEESLEGGEGDREERGMWLEGKRHNRLILSWLCSPELSSLKKTYKTVVLLLRLSVHVVHRLQQRDARGSWWQLMTAERRHVIWWAGERRPGRKPVTATRRQDTSGVYFCPLQRCCRVRMCVTSPKITLMSRKSLLWKPEVGLEV